MASKSATLRPEVAWATEVGWQEAGPLDWAAVGGEIPWSEAGDAGPFQAPPHRSLLPPTTQDALAALLVDAPDAPTAHDALELLLASPAWLVRARDQLFGPWSPVPAALAVFAEAWGIGPELHGGDAALLRLLAWMLPRWFPERGDARGAAALLEALCTLAPKDRPFAESLYHAEEDLRRAVKHPTASLQAEILGAWPARWWEARLSGEPLLPRYQVRSGVLLFQPPSGDGLALRVGDVLLPLHRVRGIPPQVSRLLPPWTLPRRFLVHENAEARRPMERDPNVRAMFQPREGSLLDLESLEAITAVSQDLWWALETLIAEPEADRDATGMCLDGLVLDGIPSTGGPPGALEPRIANHDGVLSLSVGAGRVLMLHQSRAVSASLASTSFVPLPVSFLSGGSVAYALTLRLERLPTEEGNFAREELRPRLQVLLSREVPADHLILARSIPNVRRWETDIASIWRPGDARTQRLVRKIDELGQKVWLATPQGLVWDQALLGRDWLRYQCAAAAAMQAAGLELESRPLATASRVRLLESLMRRLTTTVPEVADGLRMIFGPSQAEGPYADALTRMGTDASVERG